MISRMNTAHDSLIPWAPAGLSLLLIDLASEALQRQRQERAICKNDGSLVTPVDTDLEARILEFLNIQDTGSRVIGEESLALQDAEYLSDAMGGRTWVIDPIDGTALYALGMEGWGISIGLMVAGCLTQGVVAYPKLSVLGRSLEMVFSHVDTVISTEFGLDFEPSQVLSGLIGAQMTLPTQAPIPNYPGQIASSQRFAKAGRYAGKHPIICFGSSVLTFRLLMGGALAGYLVKLKLWDLAAVWPMAWRLGIRCCTAERIDLDLTVSDTVWYCDPADSRFLALREHILFYWPHRIGPEVWQDISLPPQ